MENIERTLTSRREKVIYTILFLIGFIELELDFYVGPKRFSIKSIATTSNQVKYKFEPTVNDRPHDHNHGYRVNSTEISITLT